MTFDKIIDDYKNGKRIYRDHWRVELNQDSSYSMKYISDGWYEIGDQYSEPRKYNHIRMVDLLAMDWHVLE